MRRFEILLTLANLLAFLWLAVPSLRALRWLGAASLAALLLVILQIVVEGPRWQMIPAYALAVLFALIWLLGLAALDGLSANRGAVVIGFGAGLLVLIVAIALPLVFPVFHFPKPSGPYAIGTLTYHWVDAGRPELFTADPGDHRELMAQVWYPAVKEPAAPRAPYIPDADVVTPAMAHITRFPGFLFSHFRYVTTHAVEAAPIADSPTPFPVLIFLSGLGGFRSVNTFQIQELVSHGYVVVGLDQPGGVAMVRFPDGRQIPGWPRERIGPLIMQSIQPQAEAPSINGIALPNGILPYFARDVSFTLDRLSAINARDPRDILTGRLDLARLGIFGISLGGENAAEACLNDPRLKACLIMDVWMPADVVRSGLQQPTMFITRDAGTMRLERRRSGGWTENDIALTLDTLRAVYDRLAGDGYFLQIPGMFHVNFTDAAYWSPVSSLLGLTGPLSGWRGFEILNAYSLAFFDRYLNDRPSALLDGPSKAYPEVIFEKH